MPLNPHQTEQLLKGVERQGDCLVRTGSLNRKGYGVVKIGGRNGKTYLAHRVSYELFVGPIPDGMFVCHTCDNPACILPAHLWLGTNQQNMQDASRKGRVKNNFAAFNAARKAVSA